MTRHSSSLITVSRRRLCPRLINFIRNVNFFRSASSVASPEDLQNGRISTRIFFIVLVISTTVLVIYNLAIRITKTVILKQPTYDQYQRLHATHSDSLICPCSQISIEYQHFVRADYTMHQVCSSAYVSNDWINYLKNSTVNIEQHFDDFRHSAVSVFQALRMFCMVSYETIRDGLIRFYASRSVNGTLMSEELFQTRIQMSFDQFVSVTVNKLRLSFDNTRDFIQTNAIWSALSSNFGFYFAPGVTQAHVLINVYSNCRCDADALCMSPFRIIQSNRIIFIIPGLFVGCLLSEALLQSTLECFYDQTCVFRLQSLVDDPALVAFPALNASQTSRFSLNSTVGELVQGLMVEQWNLSIRHENYYRQCQPQQCSYTYSTHRSLIEILTTVFGLIGGLITILKLVIPRCVKYGRRLHRWRNSNGGTPNGLPITILQRLRQFGGKLRTLNLFASHPAATHPLDLDHQRRSTRLYLVLLCVFICVFVIHTFIYRRLEVAIIEKPAFDQYLSLYRTHSESLSCPCSQISIAYQELIKIKYTSHPLCQSVYTTSAWISYFVRAVSLSNLDLEDFRWTSRFSFQALRAFCELTNRTIVDNLNIFYTNQYVTHSLIPEYIFQLEMQAIFDQLVSSTTSVFLSSLRTIQDFHQANALMSATGNQYVIHLPTPDSKPLVGSRWYRNCSCGSSATCIFESDIYHNTGHMTLFQIPGMYFGCFVTASLLQSSLECFFDQTCIDAIISYLEFSPTINVSALDRSLLKQSSVNSSVQILIEKLMIEEWSVSVDYQQYYRTCQPTSCTYTYATMNNLLFVLTTFISLIGGLITILKAFVPLVVKCMTKLYQIVVRRLQRVRIFDARDASHRSVQAAEVARNVVMEVSGTNNRNRMTRYLLRLWSQLSDFLTNLNLYESIPPSTDPVELRRERIKTRIFLTLAIVSVMVFVFYTCFAISNKTVAIARPSLEDYLYLNSLEAQTLSCPCSKVSISYAEFLDIQYLTHELCRSIFVTKEFRDILFPWKNRGVIPRLDLQNFGLYIFQALETFCHMANRSVTMGLSRFYVNQYITKTVPSQSLFISELSTIFDQFIASITSDLIVTLRIMSNITHINSLVSGRATNYAFRLVPFINLPNIRMLVHNPRTYGDCNCGNTPTCVARAKIHYNYSDTNLMEVPGLLIGCLITEAVLQSNLQCFYNQTCLNELQYYLLVDPPIDLLPLNASSLRRFSIESPIKALIDGLMVEQWNFTSSFERYFDQCRPVQCVYTVMMRNDYLYIISALFGTVGGLVKMMRLLVTMVTKLIWYLSSRCTHRVVTTISR